VLLLAGCPKPSQKTVEWGKALPLHLSPGQSGEAALRRVNEADALGKRVHPGVHYLTLIVDRIHLQQVPGISEGAAVMVALHASGFGRDKAAAPTWLLGTARAEGPSQMIELDPPHRLGPLPYGGGEPALELELGVIAEERSEAVQGMFSGISNLATILLGSPSAQTHAQVYATVFRKVKARWKVRVPIPTLPETDGRRLVVAGHYVVVLRAPDAPPGGPLAARLALQQRELQWKENGSAYEDSPYVVLTVSRESRAREHADPIRRLIAEARGFVLESPPSFEKAYVALGRAESRASDNENLTDSERRLWMEMVRAERTMTALAAARAQNAAPKDVLARLDAYIAAVDGLLDARGAVRALLAPAEIRQLEAERREARSGSP
jgi:hypothetical protein